MLPVSGQPSLVRQTPVLSRSAAQPNHQQVEPSLRFSAIPDQLATPIVFKLESDSGILNSWLPKENDFLKQRLQLSNSVQPPCWKKRIKYILKFPLAMTIATLTYPFHVTNARKNLLHPIGFLTYFAHSNEVFDELMGERHQRKLENLTRVLPGQHLQAGNLSKALNSINAAFHLNRDPEEWEDLYVILGDFCKDVLSDLKDIKRPAGTSYFNLTPDQKKAFVESSIPLAAIAQQAYQRAMELASISPVPSQMAENNLTNPGLWHLADLYDILDQPGKAINTREQIIGYCKQHAPDMSLTASYALIQSYARFGYLDKAIDENIELMKNNPDVHEASLQNLYKQKATKNPTCKDPNGEAIRLVLKVYATLAKENPSFPIREAYADYARRRHEPKLALQLYLDLLKDANQSPIENIHAIRRYRRWIKKLSTAENPI